MFCWLIITICSSQKRLIEIQSLNNCYLPGGGGAKTERKGNMMEEEEEELLFVFIICFFFSNQKRFKETPQPESGGHLTAPHWWAAWEGEAQKKSSSRPTPWRWSWSHRSCSSGPAAAYMLQIKTCQRHYLLVARQPQGMGGQGSCRTPRLHHYLFLRLYLEPPPYWRSKVLFQHWAVSAPDDPLTPPCPVWGSISMVLKQVITGGSGMWLDRTEQRPTGDQRGEKVRVRVWSLVWSFTAWRTKWKDLMRGFSSVLARFWLGHHSEL